MSNIPSSDVPLDPFSIGGTELVARMNRLFDSVHSGHLSNIRPPLVSAGGLWSRENPDGSHSLILYDGTADAIIDTYGPNASPKPELSQIAAAYQATSTYVQGQVVYNAANGRFEQAKTNVAPGAYNPNQWLALGQFRSAFQTMPLPVPELPGRVFREYSIAPGDITGYGAATGAVIHYASGHAIAFGEETGVGNRLGAALFFVEVSFAGPPTGAEYIKWKPNPPLQQQLVAGITGLVTTLRRQPNGVVDQWVGYSGSVNGSKELILNTEIAFKPRTVHNNCRFVFEVPLVLYSQA